MNCEGCDQPCMAYIYFYIIEGIGIVKLVGGNAHNRTLKGQYQSRIYYVAYPLPYC